MHARLQERKEEGPVRVADQLAEHTTYARFNRIAALRITTGVGSMTCAYLFAALALVSLPAVLETKSALIIVAWVAQTFFQLVLLPVIIVGQNIQGEAADKRSEQTYKDAEAILHEVAEIQKHLIEQGEILAQLRSR